MDRHLNLFRLSFTASAPPAGCQARVRPWKVRRIQTPTWTAAAATAPLMPDTSATTVCGARKLATPTAAPTQVPLPRHLPVRETALTTPSPKSYLVSKETAHGKEQSPRRYWEGGNTLGPGP